MRLKAPDRSDLMPEVVAAALDTAFAIRRRYGRMAVGCAHDHHRRRRGWDRRPHDGGVDARGFRHHLPRDQPGVRRRARRPTGSVAVAGGRCRRRCPAPGSTSTASSPTRSGTTWTPRWRRRRGCTSSSTAPSARSSEWRRSSTRSAGVTPARPSPGAPDSVGSSPRCRLYATTNMREATAELFKLWWCASPQSPPAPLVARFGALLDRYYPPR